jgi:hypothetical protein
MLRFYAAGIEANVSADEIAEVICGALADPKRRFRYACGWGGAELCSRRARISDEEWIRLGGAASDDEYYREFQILFGLDLLSAGAPPASPGRVVTRP